MKITLFKPSHVRASLAGCLLSIAVACPARADAVTDWNVALEAALRNPTPSIPVQARISAIVHTAMYDAVNGIARKYAPVYVTDAAPPGARAEAAAIYAAHTTLVALFPAKQSVFDAQLTASLATLPGANGNSASIAAGRAWGENVARQILAWRANDAFNTPMTYPGNTGVGHWRHAPLGDAPAGALTMSATLPFALTDLASFDPGPPYGKADRAAALATPEYAADVNETKARGGVVSAVRTQAEADLGLLIHLADVPDINTVIRRALPPSARLVDKARTFALLNIAANDATVVCFQAKYKYGFWRPLQAIPYADLDGNPATIADPSWKPLGTTPSHPEYISGHSTVVGAMLAMAAALLGDDTRFTLATTNAGAPAIAPEFASFSAMSDAITEARINLGFHFRTACRLGQRTGYAVANQLARHALLPASSSGMINVAVRGRVGPGEDTLIAGFNIAEGSRRTLIRGLGPALTALRVAGAIADPKIVLFDSAGRIVAENDNWLPGSPSDPDALITVMPRCGAFPLQAGSRDAALMATLTPGSYTIHATGVGSAAGTMVVEVYELP